MKKIAMTAAIIVFAIAYITLFVSLGTAAGKKRRLKEQFLLESRLDTAYTVGYWKGVNVTLKHYPPSDNKVDLAPIFHEMGSYKEDETKRDETKP